MEDTSCLFLCRKTSWTEEDVHHLDLAYIGGGGGEGEKLDSYVEYRDRNKISTFPSPHKKMVTENCKFSLFERYAQFLSA